MNGTFCIDKRIGYLALFAVPLMVLTTFSLMVSSQKVTQNSRASGPASTSFLTIEPTPVLIPTNVCLKIGNKRWVETEKKINKQLPLRVYGRRIDGKVDYLAFYAPFEDLESSINGYESYLGMQGGTSIEAPVAANFDACPK